MELTDENQYRNTSLLNNRRNDRKQGQHCPKHIKMVDRGGGCTCKVQFIIKWDLHGFYINLQQKGGNPYHASHPKVLDPCSIPLPTRLLTSDKIEDTLHFVKSTSNNGSAQNYLHGKFGKFVNTIKIAYLHREESGHLLSMKDDIDHMMENFELSKDISFVSLSDVPVRLFFNSVKSSLPKSTTNQDNAHQTPTNNGTVTLSTVKDFLGKVQYTEINKLPDISCLHSQIHEERCERNLTMSMHFSLLSPGLLNQHSNYSSSVQKLFGSGFHLLTFSSCLSIEKQIVWLWIFIPN
jgi:hypothetical protein